MISLITWAAQCLVTNQILQNRKYYLVYLLLTAECRHKAVTVNYLQSLLEEAEHPNKVNTNHRNYSFKEKGNIMEMNLAKVTDVDEIISR